MPDAHHLLGLQPDASAHQIRRAFRHLAMRWHPDRNPAPDAAEHFKRLRQAHDELLAALNASSVEPNADAASRAQAHAEARGADLEQVLDLDIEQCFLGGRCELGVPQLHPCMHCAGTGIETLTVSRMCEPCRGSGRIRTAKGLVRCTDCDGRGYSSARACTHCAGVGTQTVERRLEVRIPPGMAEGDELRLAGEGRPHADPRHRPGDLRLRIRCRPHALFRLEGRNLVVRHPVSALRQLMGGSVEVPHPGGFEAIMLEPAAPSGRRIHVAGAGLPAKGNKPAGELIVELEPVWPRNLTPSQRTRLQALENELLADAASHYPELAQAHTFAGDAGR